MLLVRMSDVTPPVRSSIASLQLSQHVCMAEEKLRGLPHEAPFNGRVVTVGLCKGLFE